MSHLKKGMAMKKYIGILTGLALFLCIDSFAEKKLFKGKGSKSVEMSLKKHEAANLVAKPNVFRNKQDPERYRSIKIGFREAIDEIQFWSRQLSEHALFLHLGLEEPSLKLRGKMLHNQFETFRKHMNSRNLAYILPLTKKLRDYKVDVLTALNSGKWIGWIYPGFAKHITLELDYFVDKLNGIPYSDQDEIAFWNMINSDHAAFAAHLLDSSERELFEKADALSQKISNIVKTEKDMLLQISLKAAKELDAYNRTAQKGIKNNTVKSIIHPVLIDHVVREGDRSIRMFNSLKNTEGAIYPQGPQEFMVEEEVIMMPQQ